MLREAWSETRSHALRDAIAVTASDASRAIAVAQITLTASYAMLALVPIRPMQQLAFVMAGSILLDTFFVRRSSGRRSSLQTDTDVAAV